MGRVNTSERVSLTAPKRLDLSPFVTLDTHFQVTKSISSESGVFCFKQFIRDDSMRFIILYPSEDGSKQLFASKKLEAIAFFEHSFNRSSITRPFIDSFIAARFKSSKYAKCPCFLAMPFTDPMQKQSSIIPSRCAVIKPGT